MSLPNKLVVFSPLPPCENGIADYTAELLPLHARDFEVTVVLGDNHPPPAASLLVDEQGRQIEVLFLAEYRSRAARYAEHLHLYHLGNNPDHVYMLPLVLERPGIIVLHDISLHYLIDCATLRWGDMAAYVAILRREYGPLGLRLGRQFEEYRWRERAMFYELPLTRTLLARSKGVIVHSAYGFFKVKAQVPDVPITLIPHHLAAIAESLDSLDRQQVRWKLGLGDVDLVLLSLGFITKAKQIDAVFRVLAVRRAELPPFKYVLAGGKLPDQFDVDAAIAQYGLEDVVIVTDYVNEERFFEYIVAADVVINLRYPTGGETSGTLIRALGCGACVVVVDHGPFAELPDDICVKVPWSKTFGEDLELALIALLQAPEKRIEIGARAKRFLRERHAIEKSAGAYTAFLQEAAMLPEKPWGVRASHKFLELRAREKILVHSDIDTAGALWVREGLVPEASCGKLGLLSDRADTQLPWLHKHGYELGKLIILGAEPADHLPSREVSVVVIAITEPQREILEKYLAMANSTLAFGGLLIIDLTRVEAEEDDSLFVDFTFVERALARHGFVLRRSALGGATDVSLTADFLAGDTGDTAFEACWQAIKITEFLMVDDLRHSDEFGPEALA